MELDEEMRRKIVVSVGATLLFVGGVFWVGITFNDDGLSGTGGLALVGVIVGFVLLMALAGVYLSGVD